MSRISRFALTFVSSLLLVTGLQAQTTDATTQSSGASKVRIVRLSEVKGVVHLDRNTDRGFEAAMANLPVVEHNRLRTDDGVAEVEFEDNSTLRLGPDSLVEFPQLERLQSGATVSSVHVLKGTAYVSLVKSQGNQFHLLFGDQDLALSPATHIRLQMAAENAKLAVLDGNLQLQSAGGPVDVSKKKTVTFALASQNPPLVAKDVAPDALDSWDKDATGYHARTASMSAFGNSPYAYGLNDMAYYGSFMDGGSCGMMWRPYFASAAWDPYGSGAYAFYPGAGYSWVSPYPWAWTPYHYGNWAYCPNMGWGWQPGGYWNGLGNTGGAVGLQRHKILLASAPRAGEPTMVAVNLKSVIRSEIATPESFVFRKDSAGLGIPRDGMGRLDKFSHTVETKGIASERIYMEVPSSLGSRDHFSNAAMATSSIHRGSAPTQSERGGFSGNLSNGSSGGGNVSASSSSSVSTSHGPSGSSGGSHH